MMMMMMMMMKKMKTSPTVNKELRKTTMMSNAVMDGLEASDDKIRLVCQHRVSFHRCPLCTIKIITRRPITAHTHTHNKHSKVNQQPE